MDYGNIKTSNYIQNVNKHIYLTNDLKNGLYHFTHRATLTHTKLFKKVLLRITVICKQTDFYNLKLLTLDTGPENNCILYRK